MTRADPRAAAGPQGAGIADGRDGGAGAGAGVAAGPDGAFAAAAARVGPLDTGAAAAARARHDRLTKPPGSLGRLEDLGVQLAAIAGTCPPPRPTPAAVAVFAADHGVVARGVTAWPQEVTAQMVAGFLAGGAAISVLARQLGAGVTVVDVGVATDLPTRATATGAGCPTGDDVRAARHPDGPLLHRAVRAGTADLAAGPAMTPVEARAALDVGAAVADELVAAGAAVLVTGDMGIGNTTPSAALVAALTGRPAAAVVGPGAGSDARAVAAKVAAVEQALARLDPAADPLTVLAEVGGLEIAALAGFMVGGAARRVPVVLDGVVANAALLVAAALCPAAAAYAVAGHRSSEPGATAALAHLGLEPLLDLGLRLGEGSGAVLALPLLDAAAAVLAGMATFEEAGVATGPTPPGAPK